MEYVRYFHRQSVSDLDYRETAENVWTVGGFSVVSQKSGRQRKILMQRAFNYYVADVRKREDHRLHGGGALMRLHRPGGGM